MIRGIMAYDKLSEKDPNRFELHLLDWIERLSKPSTMIFDEDSLCNVSLKAREFKMTQHSELEPGVITTYYPSRNKRMRVDILILEWIPLKNGKCVMNKISTVEGNTLYQQSEKWNETTLWYGY